MAVSKAHARASAKYNAKTYKPLQVQIKTADYYIIDDFCKRYGISKAQFVLNACMDFIKRDELPEGLNTIQNDSQNNTNTDI